MSHLQAGVLVVEVGVIALAAALTILRSVLRGG